MEKKTINLSILNKFKTLNKNQMAIVEGGDDLSGLIIVGGEGAIDNASYEMQLLRNRGDQSDDGDDDDLYFLPTNNAFQMDFYGYSGPMST